MAIAFKDRPMSTLDNAIYWIEYAIRTKGELIRTYARHMNWFVYYSLDVILLIILVFVLILYLIAKLCALMMCQSKTQTSTKNKQKGKQKKN